MSLMEPTIMGLLPHERSESGFGHAVAQILAERFPVHAAKQLGPIDIQGFTRSGMRDS